MSQRANDNKSRARRSAMRAVQSSPESLPKVLPKSGWMTSDSPQESRSERSVVRRAAATMKSYASASTHIGVDFDAEAACTALARADKALGRLIECVGEFRLVPRSTQSPYEALAEAIVYQQLGGKAAATIVERLKALFAPSPFPEPERLAATPEALLRGVGLSGAKAAALRDLAAKTIAGVVPSREVLARMNDDEIIEALTTIRGVGRWTVEMLLIFGLGRPDVLPATDYGVRKGFALTYGSKDLPSTRELLARGERWRPFRSVASWYLWRALELPPGALRASRRASGPVRDRGGV